MHAGDKILQFILSKLVNVVTDHYIKKIQPLNFNFLLIRTSAMFFFFVFFLRKKKQSLYMRKKPNFPMVDIS